MFTKKSGPKMRSIKASLKKLEVLEAAIKEFYSQKDALLEKLAIQIEVGEVIDIGGGQVVEHVDNFANTNVVFRPAAVRRFEVRVRNKKKGETNETVQPD